ncbi:MAG: porin [Thiofilum sp.]|uniref:porin n=1 Tax=Thiofilum sp. TaxID=2212733 RepID=UPI0025D13E5B|nr:porin [Thiofilum sp.]MBK8454018.1 porin [Thiofilum sp.]
MKLQLSVLTLIAAGLIATTTANAAEDTKAYYGSVRVGVTKSSGASTDFANWNSRLGIKGETEVRPGLTGFGKYELGINIGNKDATKDLTTRHAYLGLKGKMGELLVGKTDTTYYNLGVAPVDIANWWSCNGCVGNIDRKTSVMYTKSLGKLSVGAAHTMRDGNDDKAKGNELGVSYKVGNTTLGLAAQKPHGEKEAISAVVGGSTGKVTYAAYIGKDKASDEKGVDLHLGYGNYYFTVGQKDTADAKPLGYTLGYGRDLGKNFSTWVEANRKETKPDVGSNAKTTSYGVALRYDF